MYHEEAATLPKPRYGSKFFFKTACVVMNGAECELKLTLSEGCLMNNRWVGSSS